MSARDLPPERATGSEEPAELTLTDAAKATGVHRSTIRRYLDAGRFAGAHRAEGSAAWLIPVADLIAVGLRPELGGPGAGEAAAMASLGREALQELEYWRRRAEVAEAVAVERERSLDDLRAALEALRDALRAVGGPEGTESPSRRPRRS